MLRLAQKDLGAGSMSQSWLGHWGHEWLPNWHLACGGSIATWLRGVPQHPGMGWRIHPELGWWVSNHQPSSTIITHSFAASPQLSTPLALWWESRRKAASPRSINNAHQLPGASSRLTPLELDANLQASASWGVRARAAVPPWHWCYWYFWLVDPAGKMVGKWKRMFLQKMLGSHVLAWLFHVVSRCFQ